MARREEEVKRPPIPPAAPWRFVLLGDAIYCRQRGPVYSPGDRQKYYVLLVCPAERQRRTSVHTSSTANKDESWEKHRERRKDGVFCSFVSVNAKKRPSDSFQRGGQINHAFNYPAFHFYPAHLSISDYHL